MKRSSSSGRISSLLVIVMLLGMTVFTGCGCASQSLSLEGMWAASDGTTKVFGSNGVCQNVTPIDIGGIEQYSLSSGTDSQGRYTLMVTQHPNQYTWYVKDLGGGKVQVYEGSSKLLWTMNKK